MSLLHKIEQRDYTGGTFTNPFGPPFWQIPTNGQLAFVEAGNSPVTTENAMKHWAVFSCVRLIADVISTLPIDCMQGSLQMLQSATPLDPLPTKLQTPSAYAGMLDWLWQVMASLLLQGNAYGIISGEDRLGYPTQIDLLDPTNVTVIRDKETGMKMFRVGGGKPPLPSDKVWHLPGPMMPGDLQGMAPIRYAARTIQLGLGVESFADDYFSNGINPTAVLESDQLINSDQASIIKKRVKDGAASRDVVVLGAGLKLNKWQITPEESMFLETQRLNAAEIAQIFGVPPEFLGVTPQGRSVTYANREQRAQDFLMNAINPWLARLENSLSAWFPRGTFVKFNTAGLLRSDLLTRYQAHQIGITTGFELRSEARALENMPPVEGIDDLVLPPSDQGTQIQDDTPNPG